MKVDVIIIGAGITGLAAGIYLKNAGKKVMVLESSSKPGGQLVSEKIDGFVLDNGFHVLLSEFPELKILDTDILHPQKFWPGVYINQGELPLKLIADPSRLPKRLFSTLFNGVGSMGDKFKLWSLRQRLRHMSVADIFQQPEMSTADVIRSYGFSNSFTEKFIKPFFGGVFLDVELTTSRKMFDFYYKMLCEGTAILPKDGLEMIANQLASAFVGAELGLETRIKKISGKKVTLENGMEFSAPDILVCSDEQIQGLEKDRDIEYNTITTFYYKYSNSPFEEPFLAVNGLKGKLVNHIAVVTDISARYSYTSDALISVNVVNNRGLSDDILTREVKKELKEWFGPEASYWELIRFFKTDRRKIKKVSDTLTLNEAELSDGVYFVPDFCLNGSINGSISAGRQIARHITGEKPLQRIKEIPVTDDTVEKEVV